jgi:hypothetical protein
MTNYLQQALAPAVLPATVLLALVVTYWLVTLLSGWGFDALDLDLDLDADAGDASFSGMLGAGAISLNFLNIGQLPINIWFSVFSLSFWVISMLWPTEPASVSGLALVVLRNAAIALIPTKLVTQPLRGKFDPREPDQAEDLLGSVGEVTTAEVNPQGGQARFLAGAAPLLLNVKTTQSVIAKGEHVEITAYDSGKHIYTVERANLK